MKTYNIDYSSLSIHGTDKENEDSICVSKGNITCFILADGLGGHSAGSLASQLAAKAACDTAMCVSELTADSASRCFTAAQCAVTAAQKENGINCRTTMTLLLTDGKKALYGHIGDSRVYHVRKKRVMGRTLDHSVPQMLLSMGSITEEELAHHPDRNRIIRAVGGENESFLFDLSSILRIGRKDSFLLCSDGFWEWIKDEDIINALETHSDAEAALNQLSALVSERLQLPCDDRSAILVRFR